MKPRLIYTLSLSILLINACNKEDGIGLYRIDIQQGNNITWSIVNKLEAGMSKKQVLYIMGTPLLIDIFHKNRWDYIYSCNLSAKEYTQSRLTVFFNQEEMFSHINFNDLQLSIKQLPAEKREYKVTIVTK